MTTQAWWIFLVLMPRTRAAVGLAQAHRDRLAHDLGRRRDQGPAYDRRYTYESTFIMRELNKLHITFMPV
jgi:hypothetical protein